MTKASQEPDLQKLKEQLAAIEHERWANWQRYVHNKMVEHSDGKGEWVCLPVEYYKRWERQINTDYKDLTTGEQGADMREVNRYWPLIEKLIHQREQLARIEENKKHLARYSYYKRPDKNNFVLTVETLRRRIAWLKALQNNNGGK